jgi:hypothetical protein
MDILGHSEIAMTMHIYTHVVPELQPEAAQRMDSVLNRPRKRERERKLRQDRSLLPGHDRDVGRECYR